MGLSKGMDVGRGIGSGRIKGRVRVQGVVLIARGGCRERWRSSSSSGGGGRRPIGKTVRWSDGMSVGGGRGILSKVNARRGSLGLSRGGRCGDVNVVRRVGGLGWRRWGVSGGTPTLHY